jgi:TRAP-type C4-dicarboxylate transport system substrate-binding protein
MYEPVLMSKRSFDKLNKAQQDALMKAAKKAEDFFAAESKKLDEKLVDAYKKNNVKVVTMSDAQANAWRDVAKKTSYKTFSEKVPTGAKLIEMALSVQ